MDYSQKVLLILLYASCDIVKTGGLRVVQKKMKQKLFNSLNGANFFENGRKKFH